MIPKFRAWDTFKKKWVKYFYITENGLIYNMEQQHRDLIGAVPIEKSGLILMQSTGLFDKNGVEIFEGDVASYRGHIYIVLKKYAAIGLALLRNEEPTSFHPLLDDMVHFNRLEVLGNIHEHPELVEMEAIK